MRGIDKFLIVLKSHIENRFPNFCVAALILFLPSQKQKIKNIINMTRFSLFILIIN